jgi:hypothetical protein
MSEAHAIPQTITWRSRCHQRAINKSKRSEEQKEQRIQDRAAQRAFDAKNNPEKHDVEIQR